MTLSRRGYGLLALDGVGLTDGARRASGIPADVPHFLEAVRSFTGAIETVVWVHESGAEYARALGAAELGNAGWGVLRRDGAKAVHLAPAERLTGFGGLADAGELFHAAEAFAEAMGGLGLVISPGKTVHQLITNLARPGPTEPEPEITWANSAYQVEAHEYWADELPREGFVRLFDRSGSYLSAWSGLNCSDGHWFHITDPPAAFPGPERGRAVGYHLVDVGPARAALGDFPDPFVRWAKRGGPVWLTTPLLQLAVDLAGAPLTVAEAWWCDAQCRALDAPAAVLRDGRSLLQASKAPAEKAALDAFKDGYATANAWFEFGPRPPAPLARPYWRRAVIDRFVANTARALAKASPAPFVWGCVDTVGFAVGSDAWDLPDGLRLGTELGAWKPLGRPVAVEEAAGAKNLKALIALAEADG